MPEKEKKIVVTSFEQNDGSTLLQVVETTDLTTTTTFDKDKLEQDVKEMTEKIDIMTTDRDYKQSILDSIKDK